MDPGAIPTIDEGPDPGERPFDLGLRRRGRIRAWLIAAGAGALWGAASFDVLWGYTAIQVTRRFVDSLPGLLSLLPARVVLSAIHLVETRVVHRSFSFTTNHQWIGVASVAAGALIGVAASLSVMVLRRATRMMFLRLDRDRRT